MNMKEKLGLMKQIDADNKKHVEEFIQAHMKIWVADYAFVDRDGNRVEEKEDDPVGLYRVDVEALNINVALEKAEEKLMALSEENGWRGFLIYDIGICNNNIW